MHLGNAPTRLALLDLVRMSAWGAARQPPRARHPPQEPEQPYQKQGQDHEEVEQGHQLRTPVACAVPVPALAAGVGGVVEERHGGLALVVGRG